MKIHTYHQIKKLVMGFYSGFPGNHIIGGLPLFPSFPLYPSSSTMVMFLTGLSVCSVIWDSQNGQELMTI